MHELSCMPLIDPLEGIRIAAGSPSLYLCLISRFPHDPSCLHLDQALQRGDPYASFLHAHTLKGLCAQLALPALLTEAAYLCDLLRSEDVASLTAACDAFPALLDTYQKTLIAIADYQSAGRGNP